ncbi:hypothetical protein BDK51DRAFT_29696 [Blyttiomyces helicus]|uniref:Uncharacterized protein n=1 Tax=Blyttiomyces helicus TaxID=388810 RepID=A0A4P9WC58_9FUNG|nr:hypothetical protein BDK51DRAFT_29696 [Blyttiomyces helicus]|eukprot:RKO89225.1 hypothetical protein BDK51DRAFT_29696 [Blyttiomyces helicus]
MKTTTTLARKTSTTIARKTTSTSARHKTTSTTVSKTTTAAYKKTAAAVSEKTATASAATTGSNTVPVLLPYFTYQHFTGSTNCDPDSVDITLYGVTPWTCGGSDNCGDTKNCHQFNTNLETVPNQINFSSCGYNYGLWYDNQCTPVAVMEGNSARASWIIPMNNYANTAPGVGFSISIYSDTSCNNFESSLTFIAGTCGHSSFAQLNTGTLFSIKGLYDNYDSLQSTLIYDESTGYFFRGLRLRRIGEEYEKNTRRIGRDTRRIREEYEKNVPVFSFAMLWSLKVSESL